MTDAEALQAAERARRGDTAAFEAIVTAYEKLLYNLALRSLGSPEDAPDAVQETFLRAYAGLGGFRGEGRLSAWLCRILNHVCVDALRRRRETVSLSRTDEGGEEQELEVPDERFDPAALAEREDLIRQVRKAVYALPPDFREPLLLREYGGFRYDEIAGILSLDEGTVKSRIFRARKRLCGILADYGNFSEKPASKKGKGGERA